MKISSVLGKKDDSSNFGIAVDELEELPERGTDEPRWPSKRRRNYI